MVLRVPFNPTLDGGLVDIGDGSASKRSIRFEVGDGDPPFWLRTNTGLVIRVDALPWQGVVDDEQMEMLSAAPGGGGGSELFANRPTGLTTLLDNDGSVAQDGNGAFGSSAFNNWYTTPGGSVDVVADATSPGGSGSAIRFNWEALGDGVGHAGQASADFGPWDTFYVSWSHKYVTPGWVNNLPKIFYFGDDGNDHWLQRSPGGGVRVIPQGRSDVLTVGSGVWPDDVWAKVEALFVGESSPGAGDGICRVWIDGVLVGEETAIVWNGAPGFGHFQWYGHADSGITGDWEYRVGHLYIGGKN